MAKILLLGAPGSGKGTQAQILSNRLSVPHISTGDMLRAAVRDATPLGKMAQGIMEQGGLLPDDIMLGIVQERLQQADCERGFILDGFPRTEQQAKALNEFGFNQLDVINIMVPFENIVTRISGRRVHLASGRAYHIIDNPPKEEGKDDVTGEALVHRKDDTAETVQVRLDVYQKEITSMIAFYQNNAASSRYIEVEGTGKIDAITERIIRALSA